MAKKSKPLPKVVLTVDGLLDNYHQIHEWKTLCAGLLDALREISKLKNAEARAVANRAIHQFQNRSQKHGKENKPSR